MLDCVVILVERIIDKKDGWEKTAMTFKNTEDKVKIFISSKCDNPKENKEDCFKYGVMRKSIKLLLEETGMCSVFIFEDGNASSYSVEASYMDRLEESDLVIIIIDNKDEVSGPTLKEIQRAKILNKKCIFVFCDEREKRPTEVQNDYFSSVSDPRYCIANRFMDIPEKVYDAVIEDVLHIYRGYCRGRIVQHNDLEETHDGVNDEIILANDSDISKEFLAGFAYTKYILNRELGISVGTVESESEKDHNCACLLGWIIGSSLTKEPNFDGIKQDVSKMHKGNIQKLVRYRYDAVKLYFEGDLLGCIGKLKDTIELIDSYKNIPKWLLNDVAIDLRNVQFEADKEKNKFNPHSMGQEIIERDQEPLYYPLIDRIVSDYNEGIIERNFKNSIQSPYTVSLGGGNFDFDKICNAFIVAYYYGSLTHMILIRKRICDYTASLALELRNHRLFMFSVRQFLLANEEKKLRQFLETYGENTNNTNEFDMDNLICALGKQPLRANRLLSRVHAIRFFGYYYSDELFEKESYGIINEIKECFNEGFATAMLVKPYLDALMDNTYRFNESAIMEFVYYIFRNKYKGL